MKFHVKVTGLKELEAALGQLPKAAAKGAMRRALVKGGAPIAQHASAIAPVASGELRGAIQVSTRVQNDVGKAEFSAVMRAGGTRAAAGTALRAARKASKGTGSFAMVLVGPSKAKTKADAIKRIVQEFGSRKMPPNPYMRPAWDSQKDVALAIIRKEMAAEIIASARRLGRSKRHSIEIKQSAAMAALMAHEVE
jgi:HK97 gp10 family phage protein